MKYLLISINDERKVVEELLAIDNDIQTTSLKIEDIENFIKDNISKHKFFSLTLTNDVVILTEGNPLLIIQILNDFSGRATNLFISREYVAINKWLVKKCLEYLSGLGVIIDITVDIEASYNHYLDYDEEIMIVGTDSYLEGTQNDFSKPLIKLEVEY